MAWTLTTDLKRYIAEAGGFLRADPVANTVALSVIDTLRSQGGDAYGDAPATFGWWRGTAGGVEGAFHYTSPRPPLLSSMPEPAARDLAELLAHDHSPLPGVNADQAVARAFATTWNDRTGTASRVGMHQRLYRLERLRPPDPLPRGASRVATARDRDLVLAWVQAFHEEAGTPGELNPAVVDDRIGYGGVTLWDDVDGTTVCMAGRTRVAAGVARVAPVYTPPERRRQGFGAAATAAVTEDALNAGAQHVVLFTDLANPTSNGIYQQIGYRPVSDRVLLTFTTEDAH